MPKMNKEEYEVLKSIDDKWKWIARDDDRHNDLCIHPLKPIKEKYTWTNIKSEYSFLDTRHLQFIQWNDEEPYSIAGLIEEYEIEQYIKESVELGEQAIRDHARKQIRKENEGTEVKKDKTWLLDEIERITDEYSNQSFFTNYARYMISEIEEAVYQLDEPEVLTEEWIDENKKYEGVYDIGYYIPVNKLYGKVVPKQTEREQLEVAYKDILERGEFWFDDKKYKVVEVEQKYYVMNNDNRMMLCRKMDGKTITEADPFKLEAMYEGEKESHRLTEQEIKDYDPRYWAFRKLVEELEE